MTNPPSSGFVKARLFRRVMAGMNPACAAGCRQRRLCQQPRRGNLQRFNNCEIEFAVGGNAYFYSYDELENWSSEKLITRWERDRQGIKELHQCRLSAPSFFSIVCSLAFFFAAIFSVSRLETLVSAAFLVAAGLTVIVSSYFYIPLCNRNQRWIAQYQHEMDTIAFLLHQRQDIWPGSDNWQKRR